MANIILNRYKVTQSTDKLKYHPHKLSADTENASSSFEVVFFIDEAKYRYGFELDDKKLRRAGLDYHEWVNVHQYASLTEFVEKVKPNRLFALTTKGSKNYADVSYQEGDALLFGPETRGLPDSFLYQHKEELKLYLPMKQESRSLNLSNTVAIVLFEAWKKMEFVGAG